MRRIRKALLFLCACMICTPCIIASGPKLIAKINRSLWPYTINSAVEFDFASKMEMLVFVEVFQQYEKITVEDSIKKHLGIEKISIPSINAWKEQVKKTILSNFESLKGHSDHDFIEIQKPLIWKQLVTIAGTMEKAIPENLKVWRMNAKDFYVSYIYEQMRLAALFPRITSEIMTLQSSETNGFNYGDKQFLLTFDDGPTVANGNTDKLITTLKKNNFNGVFFVLGDYFNVRLKASSVKQMHELYKNMVIGSHGKEHKQHTKYDAWQFSLSYTNHLIDSVAPENTKTKYFRPPYGQRNDKIITYLSQNNSSVMLWNIDSQDWNAKISSKEVADRVITLMLLWRKGILLFHDIHPKANEALPIVWETLKCSSINWMDAKKLD